MIKDTYSVQLNLFLKILQLYYYQFKQHILFVLLWLFEVNIYLVQLTILSVLC